MTAIRVTMLGCGSSGGVPLITGNWGACDPTDKRNLRRRPALLIQSETTNILVDAGPDVRAQLMSVPGLDRLDALIITHDHADHTHGLDELRFWVYAQRKLGAMPLPVYFTDVTEASLAAKFFYLFKKTASNDLYPALFAENILTPGSAFTIGDIHFSACWLQPHGSIESLGFRIGDFAYSTDCVNLGPEHFQYLQGLNTWIADAVRYEPHGTHAHLDMLRDWVKTIAPQKTYITHMSQMLDYATVQAETPEHISPGVDGLEIGVLG